MTRRWIAVKLAALWVLGAACDGGESPTPVAVAPARVTEAACPAPPGGRLAYDVRCSTLTVPASHAAAGNGKTITLFALVVRSKSATPAPDPLVFVAGGPGESSVETALLLATRATGPLAGVLAQRDVVAIDHRGVAHSTPSLQCPEALALGNTAMLPMMGMAQTGLGDAFARCRERLAAAGVDLDNYRLDQAADDLAAARLGLGYDKWNVLGMSYGSRLALELMRRHPEGLRSVILDAVWPADREFISESPVNFARALELVFAGCEAQPSCAAAYPDLRGKLAATMAALDAKPVSVPTSTGTIMVTGSTFGRIVGLLLYVPAAVALLPEIIFQVSEGDRSFLGAVFAMMMPMLAALEINYGLYYSVMCADAWPFTSAARVEMAAAAVPAHLRAAFRQDSFDQVCPRWKVPPSPASITAPVQSALPTLLLSGAHDPVTPPTWGEHARTSLSASFHFTIKNEAHISSLSACGARLAAAFLEDPTRAPASDCVDATQPLRFQVER